MKRFLTPVVLLTFLFPSIAYGDGVKFEDLVKREGLYYTKFSDVPFTGKTTGRIQASLKNGKHHGPRVEYWENGQLYVKGNWKNGEMDGLWVSFYVDGSVFKSLTGTFQNGVKVD